MESTALLVVLADDDGAHVEYVPDFLPPAERALLRAELEEAHALFDHDRVRIYGRVVNSPRLVCAFGDPGLRYRYAGVDRATHPWPPALRAVRDRLAALAGHPFNYALVNWYRDGKDYIGWHADKEDDLVPGASIASLSLGSARAFQLRHRRTREVTEVLLDDGSLLWMKGTTQQHYQHALPRRRGVAGVRFNVTFRWIAVSAPPAEEQGP